MHEEWGGRPFLLIHIILFVPTETFQVLPGPPPPFPTMKAERQGLVWPNSTANWGAKRIQVSSPLIRRLKMCLMHAGSQVPI